MSDPAIRAPALDRVLGYRRVSSGEQAGPWRTSLRQQTEAIVALAGGSGSA